MCSFRSISADPVSSISLCPGGFYLLRRTEEHAILRADDWFEYHYCSYFLLGMVHKVLNTAQIPRILRDNFYGSVCLHVRMLVLVCQHSPVLFSFSRVSNENYRAKCAVS